MSEETLVAHCSPVLAGLKTANMFCDECGDPQQLYPQLRRLNRMLGPKGLRIIPLRCGSGKALLYLYRPNRLEQDLADESADEILRECGYPREKSGNRLARLWQRLRSSEDFPHEIGLFLGYPPEDVRGFIEQGPRQAKCTGYWQVYGDEEKAQRTFARFRKCTNAYCMQLQRGAALETLAVSERHHKA